MASSHRRTPTITGYYKLACFTATVFTPEVASQTKKDVMGLAARRSSLLIRGESCALLWFNDRSFRCSIVIILVILLLKNSNVNTEWEWKSVSTLSLRILLFARVQQFRRLIKIINHKQQQRDRNFNFFSISTFSQKYNKKKKKRKSEKSKLLGPLSPFTLISNINHMGCKGLKLMVVCNVCCRGERVKVYFTSIIHSNVCDLAIDEPIQNILLFDHRRREFAPRSQSRGFQEETSNTSSNYVWNER